jgi:hypothetical protein
MRKLINETATVESLAGGLLLIHHDRSWDNNFSMGGDIVCEATAANWLADHIEAATADPWGAPDVDQEMPPDHFVVYTRGGEHGEDINVHIHNRRDPSAPRGQIYALSGISPAAAMKIVAQLRLLNTRSQAVFKLPATR